MLDREDGVLNEFNQKMYDSNIQSFIKHHHNDSSLRDLQSQNFAPSSEILESEILDEAILNTMERCPRMVKNKSLDRFQNFQLMKNFKAGSAHNKPGGNGTNNKSSNNNNENSNDAIQVYALQYIDQNLVRMPIEANDQREILNVLDLSVNKLEYFPLEVIHFSNLRVLKLDHNKIKCLPNEIANLMNLEIFSISHNLLSSLVQTLPKLTKLRELNLEANLLEVLAPDVTDCPSLLILNVNQNRLSLFPVAFKKLTKLREFHFEWFKYTNPPMSTKQKREDILFKFRTICSQFDSPNKKYFTFQEFLDAISEKKVNLNSFDDYNRTILHTASIYEDISVLKYVMSNIPSLTDLVDKDNHTALSLSILKEKFTAGRYLIKHGADPTKGGGQYGSPLHLAVRKCHYHLVRDIVKLGENLNRPDLEGQSALHHCISMMCNGNPKATKICALLLENGANPNSRNKERWVPIHIAARKKDPITINWILTYNRECIEVHGREDIFKINCKGGQYNWTAMHIAAYSECPSVVAILGEANANVFKRSLHGYTPKRLISKNCLTLKMVEKYEKRWVEYNILKKTKIVSENLVDQNLQNLNKSKEIGNASKNKFDNSYLYIDNNDISLFRGSKFEPTVNKMLMASKKHDDSDEVVPESEVFSLHDTELFDDGDTTRLDFCADLNENCNVENNMNNRKMTVPDKNIQNKPTSKHTKSKSMVHYQSFIDTDADQYEHNLKVQASFTLDFLNSEMKRFKDSLTNEKVVLTEKILIMNLMRRLHNHVLQYIAQHYYMEETSERIPILIYRDIKIKTKTTSYFTKMVNYYEVIPQFIMNLFQNLVFPSYENYLLKMEMGKILTEIRYFSAIPFLESLLTTQIESPLLKQELFQCFYNLKESLNIGIKDHSKDNKIFSKKTEVTKDAETVGSNAPNKNLSTMLSLNLNEFPKPKVNFQRPSKIDLTPNSKSDRIAY